MVTTAEKTTSETSNQPASEDRPILKAGFPGVACTEAEDLWLASSSLPLRHRWDTTPSTLVPFLRMLYEDGAQPLVLGEEQPTVPAATLSDPATCFVMFSGGKDSVAAALKAERLGKRIVCHHLSGLNRGMLDERGFAEKTCAVRGWKLIVDKVSIRGTRVGVTEAPTKNQVNALLMLSRASETGAATWTAGFHSSSSRASRLFGYDWTDGREEIEAFDQHLAARFPGVQRLALLESTVEAWAECAAAGLLGMIKGCTCQPRFKNQRRTSNESKFGRLLPNRCGSCYKCAWEQVALERLGAIEANPKLRDHQFRFIAEVLTPKLGHAPSRDEAYDYLVPPAQVEKFRPAHVPDQIDPSGVAVSTLMPTDTSPPAAVAALANAEERRVPVGELIEHPENPRVGNVDAVAESILRNGFYGTLVVQRSTMRVLAGNHRLRAARQLNIPEVPCSIVDVDDETALRILLADNRTSDLASYDDRALANALQKLTDVGGTGYSQRDLANLLRRLDDKPRGDGPAFSNEQIADAAMKHWRANGFPFPKVPAFIGMQDVNALRAMPNSELQTSRRGLAFANSFHPARYSTRCLATTGPTRTGIEAFSSDEILGKVLRGELEAGRPLNATGLPGTLMILNTVQLPCNFRPGFALWVARQFCPAGGAWLDTSAGWGGRLVGFAASNCSRYLGIDPSPLQCAGDRAIAEALGVSDRAEILQSAAEDVPHELVAAQFDFAFTSPPYFAKELYAGGPQSHERHGSSFEAWVQGFLRPLLRLHFAALKPGALNLLNIADVRIGKDTHRLARAAVEAGEAAGFKFLREEHFQISSTVAMYDEEGQPRDEPVLFFERS